MVQIARQLSFDDMPIRKAVRLPGFYMPGTRPVLWKRASQWQARLWIGHAHGGEISLGLHRSMQTAHQCWSAVIREYATAIQNLATDSPPRAILAWECAQRVWPSWAGPFSLLPKWVHTHTTDGVTQYVARAVFGRRVIQTDLTDDPRAAFQSIWGQIGPILCQRKPMRVKRAVHIHPTLFETSNTLAG
jgi:hypothetical protein